MKNRKLERRKWEDKRERLVNGNCSEKMIGE